MSASTLKRLNFTLLEKVAFFFNLLDGNKEVVDLVNKNSQVKKFVPPDEFKEKFEKTPLLVKLYYL